MSYKPYLIRTPPLEVTSGGIRAMYGLYGWLLAKGQVAYINAQSDVPAVGIYPEIYRNNDMKAETVVRYILQIPGMMAHYCVPGPNTEELKHDPQFKNDKIYVFSQVYNTLGVDDDHILFCPVLNLHLFKNQHKQRNKTAYLVGKGTNKKAHPPDSIEITREFAQDQSALADLLNECHTLYGYDYLSAMYEISRLCGCKVHYHGDMNYDQLKLYEPGMAGMSWWDGKQYKTEDTDLSTEDFKTNYLKIRDDFSIKLDKMIEETQHD